AVLPAAAFLVCRILLHGDCQRPCVVRWVREDQFKDVGRGLKPLPPFFHCPFRFSRRKRLYQAVNKGMTTTVVPSISSTLLSFLALQLFAAAVFVQVWLNKPVCSVRKESSLCSGTL